MPETLSGKEFARHVPVFMSTIRTCGTPCSRTYAGWFLECLFPYFLEGVDVFPSGLEVFSSLRN